jgi:Protein of unknown function (DUF1579)
VKLQTATNVSKYHMAEGTHYMATGPTATGRADPTATATRTRRHDLADRQVDHSGRDDPSQRRTGVLEIHASDIYEWVAGGFFVLHTAYGRIGDSDVGGIELIGYEPETTSYRSYFFDSQGNISNQDLSFSEGTWTWSGEHARATGTLSDDGRTMPTLHEWSDDGVNWRPSVDVTLCKVV